MTAAEIEITVEIACTEMPAAAASGLHLGIQREKAVTELSSADSKRIVFKPVLRARRNADGSVNFLGPYAQGPKSERFVYLNWAVMNGKVLTALIGRIKLHLNHIKWTAVQKAATSKQSIRVTLALTNAKGKPVMASVRPNLAKWELAD